jgi:hypothetical protein
MSMLAFATNSLYEPYAFACGAPTSSRKVLARSEEFEVPAATTTCLISLTLRVDGERRRSFVNAGRC